jgi:hypothetical protein
MTFSEGWVNQLRDWAQKQAPLLVYKPRCLGPTTMASKDIQRRRVRLEISAEWCADPQNGGSVMGTVARVYLTEPRCTESSDQVLPECCECGPLAEQRLA